MKRKTAHLHPTLFALNFGGVKLGTSFMPQNVLQTRHLLSEPRVFQNLLQRMSCRSVHAENRRSAYRSGVAHKLLNRRLSVAELVIEIVCIRARSLESDKIQESAAHRVLWLCRP